MLDPSHRARLSPKTLSHFSGDTLFDRIARVVCEADCLPRKELYESWEVARRTRRYFRGGRVVDLACGHGLIACLMLILDDTSPSAVATDRRVPKSAALLTSAIVREWPRLAGRITLEERELDQVELTSDDLVVSAHACGSLTDRILDRATDAHARVVVLPCCHSKDSCNTGALGGWMDDALAIDATRARKLASFGYAVRTQLLPSMITPKNRLLMGSPLPRGPSRAPT